MKNNHITRAMKREDFDSAWKLHRLFRNPKVKVVYIKCETCRVASRRTPLSRNQINKLDKLYERM